jgi:hypothetical protein
MTLRFARAHARTFLTAALLVAVLALAPLKLAGAEALAQTDNIAAADAANATDASNAANAASAADQAANAQSQANAGNTVNTNASRDADERLSPAVYSEMFKILFAVFVIAVILESALALIFNWRPFIRYFDGRGVRSVIALLVGVATASALHFDLVQRLYAALYPIKTGLGPLGIVLTGMVFAGGSAGVNNILRSLGFREVSRTQDIAPKPPKNEAWVAVRVLRKAAVKGPIQVFIERQDELGRKLVGTIQGRRAPSRLFAWALADPTRFPPVGGFRIEKDASVAVILVGLNEDGEEVSESWGPYRFEGGAIIDLQLEL